MGQHVTQYNICGRPFPKSRQSLNLGFCFFCFLLSDPEFKKGQPPLLFIRYLHDIHGWGCRPHSSTGSQLFSWELDSATLFGTGPGTGTGTGTSSEVDFRILKPGMYMRSMFDIAIHKKFYTPSQKFLADVAVRRCQLDTFTNFIT